jgi:hypothetical protein
MYKYLSILLVLGLFVLGGFFAWEKYSHAKDTQAFNNQVAKLEGTIKETETAYSTRGIEVEDLKSQNKELQNKIKSRDEDIAALGQAVLQWKDKYYKITDAHGSFTDTSGGVIEIPADCQTCLSGLRLKVDFKQEQDNVEVSGFTLTNPAYAEIKLHWTKPLVLDIILAKNDSGDFRIYVDPNDASVVPTSLNLSVDPSVFSHKWYEKIMIGADIGAGTGVITSLRLGYECFNNWIIGPFITAEFDNQFRKFYGASVGWFPFRGK